MYKAKESFTTKSYDVKKSEILEDNFTTEDEITDFLNIGYIEEYDGTLEISQNGIFDVSNYEEADVDVPPEAPTLQTKEVTITENTTTNITPNTGYDGLSSVSVITNISGGADLSEYFVTTINSDTGNKSINFVKKTPDVTISDNVTNLAYAFTGYPYTPIPKLIGGKNVTNFMNLYSSTAGINSSTTIDVSGLDTSSATYMTSMFGDLSNLTSLDLSNFDTTHLQRTNQMFWGCTSLQKIDLRSFNFSGVTSHSNMFGSNAGSGVPNDCLIIVADDTAKTWITSKFSRLTNVKTVAEYEAQ